MAKVCPQCNLSNPDSAVECSCGFLIGEADSLEDWAASVLGGFAPIEAEVLADAEAEPSSPLHKPPAPVASSDGEAPAKLPKPLGDPLRAFRHVMTFILILQIACLVITLPSILFDATRATFLYPLGLFMPAALAATFWLWSILPGRAVNAFYLRSFRNDPDTWPIRKEAQAALGRKFRLSGIRDPRRRWPPVIRYIHAAFFAIRCCTPKFMNLEAGADWKARLWRSLGEARCALIDVSDLTPFVLEEIELCRQCLGLKRLLFIGDSSRGHDAWRTQIAGAAGWLDPTMIQAIRVARWDASNVGRKEFTASVRAFAAGLPAGVAGVKPEALPLVQLSGSPEGAPVGGIGGGVGEVVLGILLGAVITWVYDLVLLADEGVLGHADVLIYFLWRLPVFAFGATEFWFIVRYLIDSSGWERARSLAIFALMNCWLAGVLVLPAVQNVRLAAARLSTSNELKEIGLAMHNYDDRNGGLPPAEARGTDPRTGQVGYPVSWRVRLLPYLEESPLFDQYRMDEPWDGPDNIQLLTHMPKVYACPAAGGAAQGHTYYRVFVSPRDQPPTGPVPPFMGGEYGAAARLNWFPDGTSDTILVVEAAEPVPWTKPDELVYDPEKPLPPLGGHFPGGFVVVFADGSVHFIKQDLKESTLRALITWNGGETMEPDP